jgi:hypothetical protein
MELDQLISTRLALDLPLVASPAMLVVTQGPIMPELPDVTIYLEALQPRVVGQPLGAGAAVEPVHPFDRLIRRSRR